MHLSPVSRLSGVVLSGILLVGSVSIPGASQALYVHPVLKPVELASDQMSTNITQFLHQQLLWKTVKPPEMTTVTETKNVQDVTNSPGTSSPPILITQVASVKTQSETQQVSRGSSASSTLVDHALSLIGTPYVFGGTTKRGFDCSGFTQYIFAGSGISLPRTSYGQFASGVAVNKNDLRIGDLLFFSTYTKGASHVGIYIGAGRFVHADNPRVGVTITSLSTSFYSTRYLGARRYD